MSVNEIKGERRKQVEEKIKYLIRELRKILRKKVGEPVDGLIHLTTQERRIISYALREVLSEDAKMKIVENIMEE